MASCSLRVYRMILLLTSNGTRKILSQRSKPPSTVSISTIGFAIWIVSHTYLCQLCFYQKCDLLVEMTWFLHSWLQDLQHMSSLPTRIATLYHLPKKHERDIQLIDILRRAWGSGWSKSSQLQQEDSHWTGHVTFYDPYILCWLTSRLLRIVTPFLKSNGYE